VGLISSARQADVIPVAIMQRLRVFKAAFSFVTYFT